MAVRRADFLVKIQCRNENELWDGGWRGAYDVHKKSWSGRANQNNTKSVWTPIKSRRKQ